VKRAGRLIVGDLTNGGGTTYLTAAAAAAAAAGGGLSAAEAPWTPALHLPVDPAVGLSSLAGFDPSSAGAACTAAAALFPTAAPQTQLVASQFAAFTVS